MTCKECAFTGKKEEFSIHTAETCWRCCRHGMESMEEWGILDRADYRMGSSWGKTRMSGTAKIRQALKSSAGYKISKCLVSKS